MSCIGLLKLFDTTSVRSSIYAVPVYKRFGFLESGPAGSKDGVSFEPMEYLSEN